MRLLRRASVAAGLASLAVAAAAGCAGCGAAAASPPAAAIRLDQVGYPTAAGKLALVAVDPPPREPRAKADLSPVPAAPFTVHRLPGGSQVLAGELAPAVHAADSGEWLRAADLSALTEAGSYELRLTGSGQSARFAVAADPYRDLLRTAVRAFYGQRCGTAVDLGPEAPGYAHPACHLAESYHPSSGRRGERPASDGRSERAAGGGWHDAGDYGRYVVNAGIASGELLWAWELYPRTLAQLDLAIPESGDATPDLLDEVRSNLEWMLTMQDADGGVWHKLTSPRFAAFVMPEDDRSVSQVVGTGAPPFRSSCASGDFAAVMAIAGRVYHPYDAAFADRALTAARRAWSWLAAHPAVVFHNPPGVETGEYGDADCGDERLWAAAELWRSAGDEAARAHLLAHADMLLAALRTNRPPDWQHVGALAAWSYALAPAGDAALRRRLGQASLTGAETIADRARAHPYRIPLTREDYVWGSNGVAASYGLELLVADRLRGEPAGRATELAIVHYLLGRNPFALSWVTGAGERSVRHPHHRPSAADGIAAPWPGLLAGGPNARPQDPVLRRLPSGSPPGRMYADDQGSYASNEVAINWQAALVFLLTGVVDGGG